MPGHIPGMSDEREGPGSERDVAGREPEPLTRHLRSWVGAWPPQQRLDIVAAGVRDRPGWDGKVRPVMGAGSPVGAVLAVSPRHHDAVAAYVDGATVADLVDDARIGDLVGRPGHRLGRGVLRWSTAVADAARLPDAGRWVRADDEATPPWLRPFNGGVLVATDDHGYVAGVGIKAHDGLGRELAVVTEPRARGRGLARRLVAQAARRVLDEGRLPTYLHGRDNVASAKVADAVGFPDRGWSVYGLFPPS